MEYGQMPHEETYGERQVRQYLVRSRIPFEQEAAVMGYDVDFLVGRTLVIEVDGVWHCTSRRRENDARKDARLQAAGYEVLRIPAEDLRYEGSKREALTRIERVWKTRHADACRVSSLSPAAIQALQEFKRRHLV